MMKGDASCEDSNSLKNLKFVSGQPFFHDQNLTLSYMDLLVCLLWLKTHFKLFSLLQLLLY